MTKYKVAYIDEAEPDIRRFQRFAYNFFEVIPFIPKDSIEETCNAILESHVDAIISDFEFSEQLSSIHYDGTNLVSLILKKRENFPVFILTSFEDDAVSKGEDVNIIYEKKEMDEGEKGEKFLERVKAQIDKYKHKLEVDEKKLLELIAESKKRKLNAFEIQELSELDSKIEKALDKESQIPNILRDDKEAEDLAELLKKVDELAKKLENKK
jgi:hypothetical protein